MAILSPKTQEMLDWLHNFQSEHAYFPTYREIQAGLEFKSVSSVQFHIRKLKAAKLVTNVPGKARTLCLVAEPSPPEEPPPEVWGIPIWGAIAAGYLVEFFPDHEVSYIPPDLFSPKSGGLERFALQVRGDSMVNAHILDKDVVILDKPFDVKEIKDGQIVAVRVDGEDCATLKRWRQVDGQVFLVPENDNYSTIQVEAHAILIEGIYVGLVRGLV